MKHPVRHVLQALVRYFAPHAGLGVFELPGFEWSTDAEDIAWLEDEHEAHPNFHTVTIH